jgi:hypothetical protein
MSPGREEPPGDSYGESDGSPAGGGGLGNVLILLVVIVILAAVAKALNLF